jgi:hypothetical protein
MTSSTITKQITSHELEMWLIDLAEHANINTIAAFYELINNVVLEDIHGDMSMFNIQDRE